MMNKTEIELLKLSAEQFYYDKHADKPRISDEEYDKLLFKYESEGNKLADLMGWGKDVENPTHFNPLSKIKIKSNDVTEIADIIREYLTEDGYITPKYDGCSVVAIYKDGEIESVLSSPNADSCIDRSRNLTKLFPRKVDPRIKALRGEALVDYSEYGELSRNKANGLVNSNQVGECLNELLIRVYDLELADGSELTYKDRSDLLRNLPILSQNRKGSLVDIFRFTDIIPLDRLSNNTHLDGEVPVQVDGYVVYNNKTIQGFKLYNSDRAVTRVKDILWNKTDNHSFAATLLLDPVTLNGKRVNKCTANGVRRLIDMRYGVGSQVKIYLANLVIPKVEETVTPSVDYKFPICACGFKLSEETIYGNVLKCFNEGVCIGRLDTWRPQIESWIQGENTDGYATFGDWLKDNPEWIGYFLFIDAWDPYKTVYRDKINEVLKDLPITQWIEKVPEVFKLTNNQMRLYESNKMTAQVLLGEFINKTL